MKAISVAIKAYKEFPRDRRALAFLLLFPVIFVLVFGSATFGTGTVTAPHEIAVLRAWRADEADLWRVKSAGCWINAIGAQWPPVH